MSSTTWLKLMAVGVLIAGLFSLAVACVPAPPAVPPAEEVAPPPEEEVAPKEVSLVLWTKEGEEPLEWNQALVQEYMEANPGVTIELVHKTTVEILREDFLTASLAGTPPDLLWTVNDHAGPFVAADTIEPVDGLFDLGLFVDAAVAAVELEGQHWGVPISSGNHLMLLYNKKLLAEAPKDTDELFAQGKELTGGGNWGLVWNQTEPFWLVPWLGGFKGKVFAEDGVTPTLNTPEMVATLKFLHDMKYEAKIIPPESDYDAADTLFKEGKAAMIINGDWALGSY
ncbi:arabinogalactan oligomer / maltooligosaccharide transport system substrate-binding protein, partial [Candidatus Hakubella thermalkaliphila]